MDEMDVILGKVYDPHSGISTPTWWGKNGTSIEISDMSDSYLVNAINYVRRRYDPGTTLTYDSKLDLLKGVRKGDKMSGFSARFVEDAGHRLAGRFARCLAHVRSMVDNPRYKHLWEEATKRGLIYEN